MTWLIPKATSCVQLLEELEHLPPTVRQSIRSITLGQNLMGFDDGENHLEVALRLAAFLLDWKELETITIAMPDDLSAAGQDTGSYDYWSWVLHEPLLRAFARGRWREVRLAHPKTYTDSNLFLYHNIECYIEDWILPLEPRRQLNLRRSRYWEDQHAGWGGPKESRHPPQDSLEAVNRDCERTWAERGIVIQAENPGPDEMGTVLAVRWRAPWMKENRQAATAPGPQTDPDLIPWQLRSSRQVPPFLQPMPQWRVVLCKEHGNCFVQDELSHHLIHHHGATGIESEIVCFLQPIQELAKSWSDVIHPHPHRRIPAIPHLQVIKGFRCADKFCQYQTVTDSSWASHNRATNHSNPFGLGSRMFYQTLSSCPTKAQYFPVYPLDDFSFPLDKDTNDDEGDGVRESEA